MRKEFNAFYPREIEDYFVKRCSTYKNLKYLDIVESPCIGTVKYYCYFSYKTNTVFEYSVQYPLTLKSLEEVFEKCIEYIESQLGHALEKVTTTVKEE